MYKIAVIGGPDTVIGFKALGLDTFPVREDAEAKHILRDLTRPDRPDEYAIIQKCSVTQSGNFVAMIVAPNAAELTEIYKKYVK